MMMIPAVRPEEVHELAGARGRDGPEDGGEAGERVRACRRYRPLPRRHGREARGGRHRG